MLDKIQNFVSLINDNNIIKIRKHYDKGCYDHLYEQHKNISNNFIYETLRTFLYNEITGGNEERKEKLSWIVENNQKDLFCHLIETDQYYEEPFVNLLYM